MNRLRIILGFIVGVVMLFSAGAHSIFGWKEISAQLANAQTPPELINGVRLGWQFGGAAMLAFGCIVLFLFVQARRNPSVTLRPALIIAICYIAVGLWAIAASSNPFFLIFVIPGLLLAFAAWPASLQA